MVVPHPIFDCSSNIGCLFTTFIAGLHFVIVFHITSVPEPELARKVCSCREGLSKTVPVDLDVLSMSDDLST